jgi:hypothetical protein
MDLFILGLTAVSSGEEGHDHDPLVVPIELPPLFARRASHSLTLLFIDPDDTVLPLGERQSHSADPPAVPSEPLPLNTSSV